MAEYIDKEKIERVRLEDSCYIIEHFKGDEIDCIIDAPIEDVIERSEYEALKKENHELAIKYDNAMNRVTDGMEEISRLRSKIDNALADMQLMLDQEVLNDNVISDVGQGIAIAMGLLRTNIGD